MTIPQAARAAGCLDRTLRRWIAAGTVASMIDVDGRRRVQRTSLPSLSLASGRDSGSDSGATPTVSDNASGADSGSLDSSALNPPSQALACECCKVREEHAATLTAQLEARTEELRRRDAAEGELRRVLALLEQTNRELSAALVVKALPPVPNLETPARVRWWWPWRR